jgi:hypothetical protein
MLDPQNRHLLLESLRPPYGYTLDCAIGTTFSLDLLTMLTLPVSFTAFAWEGEDVQQQKDTLALLEALRRHADKISVFCQSGRIAVPKQHQPLFGYLEHSVFEVEPPNRGYVFHPKVWVLRFSATSEPVIYRVLVLTRNLTFDRSWDTVLALEGELVNRKNAFSQNHPLADFVAALPDMAVRALPARVLADVEKVQTELRRVRWQLPDGCEEITFWPLGIKNYKTWPFKDVRIDHMLVISPFLSDACLQRLTKTGRGDVLISRLESLDSLAGDTISQFNKIYTLSDEASPEATDLTDEEPSLVGLHAKVYIADAGWDARIWTGSANATDAAFNGNVEFLVELKGKKSRYGINTLLGGTDDKATLSALLHEYKPSESPPDSDAEQLSLEAVVEDARRKLAGLKLLVKVTPVHKDYCLDLFLEKNNVPNTGTGVQIHCWPVTLHEAASKILDPNKALDKKDNNLLVTFGPLSLEAITSFFAFEIEANDGQKSASARFVMNLPLQGAPIDRKERVLRSLLKNREQVLRYLWFLLSEGGLEAGELLTTSRNHDSGSSGNGVLISGFPLFEALVRALHRNPESLDQIACLVNDLRQTPEGLELLPEGFDSVWQPIWSARKELKL